VLCSVAVNATGTQRAIAAAGRIRNMSDVLKSWLSATLIGMIGVAATGGVAAGHHALVMYDRNHPIVLVGTVREFKFVSPHVLIVLEVPGRDAQPVIWNLEGDSPNSLSWDGWSSETLRPGDEVRLTVEPLRSGAPGGGWHVRTATYRDGAPIAAMRGK
jgi:hypothetical protein